MSWVLATVATTAAFPSRFGAAAREEPARVEKASAAMMQSDHANAPALSE